MGSDVKGLRILLTSHNMEELTQEFIIFVVGWRAIK